LPEGNTKESIMNRISNAWIPVLCLLALCAACSSGSSTSETELAVQQFYDRLGAEDYTAVLDLYSADVRDALQISGGQVDQGYVEWAQEETKMGKVNGIEIVEESVDGDTAEVKYRIAYGDGSTSDRSVKLTQEDGEWKLV
jgi:hypothetical protein